MAKRAVIVGNDGYGVYFGWTAARDEDVIRDKAVRLTDCRHVAFWWSKTGGISSLAAHGPCGPRAKESRIGSPVSSALLTGVKNIFDATDEAVAAFARIEPRDG